MKLYVLADLEGLSAVTGGWVETNPGAREFEHARKMMTGDINACAKGAFEAGATEILVFDGHGMAMTVDPEGVNPDCRLIRGRAYMAVGFTPGLDETFDAMVILGMHAMEGTQYGVMNSTVTSMHLRLNGKEIGETGLFAALAAEMGVPTIMVAGDEAVAIEAKALIPNIYTVAVKKGLSRYSAELIPAERCWEMITETTRDAIKNYKKVGIYNPTKPVEMSIEYYGNTQVVDCVAQKPGVKRVDGNTVSYTSNRVSDCLGTLVYFAPWMLG